MEFSITQIAAMLGGEVTGDGSEKIKMLAKIQDAKKGQISFLSNPKYEQFIYTTQATAVIVKKRFSAKEEFFLLINPCGGSLLQFHHAAGGVS
jgi:UDP-3-O-[3-hydroxymyristoyl] glucosamine N-acyltransferase